MSVSVYIKIAYQVSEGTEQHWGPRRGLGLKDRAVKWVELEGELCLANMCCLREAS